MVGIRVDLVEVVDGVDHCWRNGRIQYNFLALALPLALAGEVEAGPCEVVGSCGKELGTRRPVYMPERSEANSLDLNNLPEDSSRDGLQASGDSSSSAERETETLNKARQLVFSNDVPPPHLGYVSSGGQPIQQGGYHQGSSSMDDGFRSMYPPPSRMFPTSPAPPPPQTVTYGFPSPPQLIPVPPPPHNDYYVGHVLPNPCYGGPPSNESYYTCVGAPVTPRGQLDAGGNSSMHNQDHEGLNWGRK
ncbi:hypothetical protein SASPL_142784 [Salvia splendens]|uniref:Uncharacterized protein n=1 Tax=Salvia splendens TaxID=180675 RepID=A0A8X8ZA56_SALSN|nr:hypothetical protein SASPL_142784 [Salvia splendens]